MMVDYETAKKKLWHDFKNRFADLFLIKYIMIIW